MSKQVVAVKPHGTVYRERDADGKGRMWTEYNDYEPYFRHVEMLGAMDPHKNYRYVGTLPPHIYARVLTEKWSPEDVRRWLADRDHSKFAHKPTFRGRIVVA